MNKKNFKNTGADLFLTPDTKPRGTSDTQNISGVQGASEVQNTLGVQGASETETNIVKKSMEYHRINLKLDIELKNYLYEAAWQKRMTVTGYLSALIKSDKNNNRG
jgi:hypothetical protein